MRVVGSLVACVGLISACGTDGGDPGSTQVPADGKADYLPPGSVGSQFVDPARTYLPRRAISPLVEVGGLPALAEDVARRVDGIIANQPADGYLDANELVRAEQPDRWPAFFDDEQAEFPRLWGLLEVPEAIGPEPVRPPAIDPVEDLVPPGELVFPVLQVAELRAEWQTVARRLERLHDEDGAPETVSYADVTAALESPAAFTLAEVEVLNDLASHFRGRATSEGGHARLVVPRPGATERTLLETGGLRLRYRATISIAGTRRGEDYPMGSPIPDVWPVLTDLTLRVVPRLEAEVETGSSIVIVSANGRSCLLGEGVTPRDSWPCGIGETPQFVVETWRGGERVDAIRLFDRPYSIGSHGIALSAYAQHDLVLEDGAPLHANVTATRRGYTAGHPEKASLDLVYEVEPKTYPGVDPSIVEMLETPRLALPPGRYRTRAGEEEATFEVFPQGLVFATVTGWERVRLIPAVDFWRGTKLWADVRKESPGMVPSRPYLYQDGKVFLRAGFPVLTPSDRF
jgi:hypothetical protein